MRKPMNYLFTLEWNHRRQSLLNEGLTFDDTIASDQELHRSPFFEHFMRETTHPMWVNMIKMRREVFMKFDNILRGFEVPDYLREPAERRTYVDNKKKEHAFYKMLAMNYKSEQTPLTYVGRGSFNII